MMFCVKRSWTPHLSITKNNFEKAFLVPSLQRRRRGKNVEEERWRFFERSGNETFYEQFRKACASAFPSKTGRNEPSVAVFAKVRGGDVVRLAPFL